MEHRLCDECCELFPASYFQGDSLRCRACERDTEEPETERPPKRLRIQDSLFIAALSCDLAGGRHGLWIARSSYIPSTLRSAGRGMPFRVVELARFPGLGHMQPMLLRLFVSRRVAEGEWVRAGLSEILRVLAEMV